MTSRPSSISSSEARRYLAALAATAGVLAALLAAVTFAAYRLGLVDAQNHALVGLQEQKLAAAPVVDTVFLGDSSLGSAIDAELVSRLSGRPALNLALTGAYGYGGSLNMLRKVLERHRPRLVVLVQTIDMLTRAQSPAGLYFTSSGLGLSEVSPLDVMKLYLDFRAAKRAYRALAAADWRLASPPQLSGDYLRAPDAERRRSIDEVVQQPFRSETIDPSAPLLLAKIAALCRDEGIACVYAHGPIFEGFCRSERAYLERATSRIRSTGLPVLAGTPICVPPSELGDTIDHVAPAFRDAYTRRYVDLLRAQVPAWDEGITAAACCAAR